MLDPRLWLIGALILAFVGGTSYLSGRHDGKKIERADWQKKELQAERDAADKLAAAIKDKEVIEKASQTAMVAASTAYQKELQNVQTRKDKIIADLRAGAIRLRDPGTRYPLGANPLPGIRASASGCDGGTRGELSDELAEYLVAEASRADTIVHQLTTCQAVVLADRLAGTDYGPRR